ncbi:MAG TPA: hypothetical protein VFS34_12375 [Thermoanaerobaculia bacterium]|nr:hypothetical protein [Thermoanaerobaculia bacterium]
MKIDELAAAVGLGRVRVTNRADEELHAQRLRMDEVCAGVPRGEIVEELAADGKPYPSCRIGARLADGTRVESVWAWNAKTGWAALINAYRVPPAGDAAREGTS